MNQNILMRLEKQAEKLVLDIPASLDCDEYTPLFNEKFAELIVQECCQKLENDGMVEVAMELREHFGGEE